MCKRLKRRTIRSQTKAVSLLELNASGRVGISAECSLWIAFETKDEMLYYVLKKNDLLFCNKSGWFLKGFKFKFIIQ